jgi:hypothetical protein
MTSTNKPETARRYPEAYEWNAKREREGRGRMKHATFLGILVGIGCFVLGPVILVRLLGPAILVRLFASAKENPPIGTIDLIVSGLAGLAFRQWWYNSGLTMVLSAQQMLVAIDTEHNTREIAEAMRQSQTVKS